jgi:hypothetical protein
MSWSLGIEVIVGMLILRVIVPVGITFALGYALHRLDLKWQGQAARLT